MIIQAISLEQEKEALQANIAVTLDSYKICGGKRMQTNPSTLKIAANEEVLNRLVSANTRFGFNLFAEIAKQNHGQNILISPFSVATLLAIAYNGAGGTTRQAMAETLELQKMRQAEVDYANAMLRATLENSDPDLILENANSLWARKGISLNPDFVQGIRFFYRAEVGELDFEDPAAIAAINAWVREKTNHKLDEIADTIHPSSILLLLNAVYFKGIWHKRIQFNEDQTKEGAFTLLDGSQKKHPMMSLPQIRSLRYYRGGNFQAVSLPYGKGRISMYIFLPDRHISLAEFQKSLTAENWETWMTRFKEREGHIILPRFKVKYDITLNNTLQALGMGIAFDEARASFEDLCSQEIWIDEVKHKTFVEVNEKGTEATAASLVLCSGMSRLEPFQMVVDRPFFCAIRDNQIGTILFMGSIVEPK